MAGFLTNDFYLYDPADQSKQLRFDVSAAPTSTLNTLTLPTGLFGTGSSKTFAFADFSNTWTGGNTFSFDTTFNGEIFANGIIEAQLNVDGTPLYVRKTGAGAQTNDLVKITNATGSTIYWKLNFEGSQVDANFTTCATGDSTKKLKFDCSGITTATTRTLTVPDADGTIALTSAIPTGGLAAGTYTPTRSAEANLDANVTPTEAQYLRVGNTVTVSGRVTGVDPTTTLTTTSFELTLPVASNLGAAEDLAGVAFCGAIAGQGAEITGSAANNTAVFTWKAADVTSQSWSFHFSYQVI